MALFANAATLVTPVLFAAEEGGFHAPTIDEFFPPAIFFEGTPFEINRIMLIRFIMAALLLLLFWLGTRKLTVIPSRGQALLEYGFDFVRVSIAEQMLGKKDAKRFLPILMTIFFLTLIFNMTGVIPFLNIAASSVVGYPIVLAVIAYITFIYAGLKKSPKNFLKNSLFPSGVPPVMYIVVTPIEFISTFIMRPVTLALRLLMNMVVGHLLLVLLFAATHFFLFQADGLFKVIGVGTFAFSLAFTLFEVLVAFLQAYIFTLLTTIYIQLALAEEH